MCYVCNFEAMSGFDCEFVEEPPSVFQAHCPICLLVLREPFQVPCCGKSFCHGCIQELKAKGVPCPTCKKEDFVLFENKGLQQPLYGFRVYCSNKEKGCEWQGELGQLDSHLNANPDGLELSKSEGCGFASVKCSHCGEPYPRSEIEQHLASECKERPFTCSLCETYASTHDDVVTNHAPTCEYRLVECPNGCGIGEEVERERGTTLLQYRHLEEHVSAHCPLSQVECEFADAGCQVRSLRKDLPSHLAENMVAHMSFDC